MIPVSTVAPNAAALGKFGNIPVSYVTGIPSIRIPLFEIDAGKLTIPLSLDYHGGGVRVDEVSSSLGTSWALNGLPTLSRNMIGLPDEGNGGYLSAPSLDSLYSFLQGTSYGFYKDSTFAHYMIDFRDKKKDTEPDMFSYSLNGSSGKFIYRPDGSIMQIPQTNNKVEKYGGNKFKITDEQGVTYLFENTESTQMITQSATGPGTYVSTWRVSKIISQTQADTISFSYDFVNATIERSWSFTQTIGLKPAPCGVANDASFASESAASVSQVTHSELYPKEIIWQDGKITFKNTLGRQDRPSNMRLDSVKLYRKAGAAYQLIKQAKLYQSYFYSNPIPGWTVDHRNYRLRLDSVAFISLGNQHSTQTYKMTYKNIGIAPNESFAQDRWGFNNGQSNNQSLMPTQSYVYQGTNYPFGNANVTPDVEAMQACMLESIQYPTKGKSVFEFEPHKYKVNFSEVQEQSIGVSVNGGVQSQSSTTFTVSANQTEFRYQAYISPYAGISLPDRPKVELVDQTTGALIFNVTNTNTVNNPSQATNVNNIMLNLIVGHTYKLSANVYTSTTPGVTASGTVFWKVPVTGVNIRTEGGLRIKTITNFDNNGIFNGKQAYEYGIDGTGSLLTDPSYLLANYEDVQLLYISTGCNNSQTGLNPTIIGESIGASRIYSQRQVYPSTQLSGSPVAYGSVTKFEFDQNNNPNGKSVFEYDVIGDTDITGGYVSNIGVWMISNIWKNGFLKKETHFKYSSGIYTPVSKKSYSYITHRPDSYLGLKIKPTYVMMSSVQPTPSNTYYIDVNRATQAGRFYARQVPTNTGAMLLTGTSDTTYNDAGDQLISIRNNTYGNTLHNYPTQVQTTNSQAKSIVQELKYVYDYAATGNVYQKMLNRNIVSPVITSKETNNGTQISFSRINYKDWFSDSKVLMPEKAEMQMGSNPIETRINFNNFDLYGNILEQAKAQSPLQSYRWGYKSRYPVAEVKNAAIKDTWYEGFEEGAGNSTLNDARTGRYSKTGGYTKTISNLTPGTYTLSYWRKSGNTWLWAISDVTAGSSYTITIANTNQVDDVRFYPKGALMTTYTYEPLVGMTSSTDPKGEVTFYEYDDFQRLKYIKDAEGNILKNYCYNYAGQQTGCPIATAAGN